MQCCNNKNRTKLNFGMKIEYSKNQSTESTESLVLDLLYLRFTLWQYMPPNPRNEKIDDKYLHIHSLCNSSISTLNCLLIILHIFQFMQLIYSKKCLNTASNITTIIHSSIFVLNLFIFHPPIFEFIHLSTHPIFSFIHLSIHFSVDLFIHFVAVNYLLILCIN